MRYKINNEINNLRYSNTQKLIGKEFTKEIKKSFVSIIETQVPEFMSFSSILIPSTSSM